jgi:hypothetical protein
MSVRYTATWYDVTQARQQEHTPYTQTQGGQQAGLFAVPARPALNRGGG